MDLRCSNSIRRFFPAAGAGAGAAFSNIVNHSSTSPREIRNHLEDVEPRNRYYSPKYFDREIRISRVKDIPKITAMASFAVKEFNRLKNAQLQLVRAVKGYQKHTMVQHYLLTLEALDRDHDSATYQAIVRDNSRFGRNLELSLFGLAAENGRGTFLNLFDHRLKSKTVFMSFLSIGGPDTRTRVGKVNLDELPIKTDDYLSLMLRC